MSKYGHRPFNWFESIVDKMGGENGAVRFLRGELTLVEVTPDLVRVDRPSHPDFPEWVKEILHPTFQRVGSAEFDCAKLELWLHDGQKNGVVKGQVIYDHLKSHDMLSSCTSLQDLEAIQKKGIAHFRKHFKGRMVFGWKSVVRRDCGNLYVPYLYEYDGKVYLRWRWLEGDWRSTSPALRFA